MTSGVTTRSDPTHSRRNFALTAQCKLQPPPAGASGGGGSSEAAVRAALKDYAERLPAPFAIPDIEGRVKEKTPYVVVALQEVRGQLRSHYSVSHAPVYSIHPNAAG